MKRLNGMYLLLTHTYCSITGVVIPVVPDAAVHRGSFRLQLTATLFSTIQHESSDPGRRIRHKVTASHAQCAQTTGRVLQQAHPAPSGGSIG